MKGNPPAVAWALGSASGLSEPSVPDQLQGKRCTLLALRSYRGRFQSSWAFIEVSGLARTRSSPSH